MPKRTTRLPNRHVLKTKQAYTDAVWRYMYQHLEEIVESYNREERAAGSEILEEFFIDIKRTPRTVVFEIFGSYDRNILSDVIEGIFYGHKTSDGTKFLDIVHIPYWS